jgi:hypothetical protein
VYFGIGGANPGQSLGNNGFFAGYLGMVRLQFWAAQSSYWTNAKRFLNAASTPISDANTQLLLDGLTAPSGATWPDTSPQNRTINLVGTTVRDAGVGYYRFGTGTSTNAYCNADSTNFGTINTTPAQTMSMWIRPTSNNSSYQAIAGIRPEGSYNFYLLILTNDTTEYRVTTNTVNPHDVVVSFGQFYTRWTHVTCVADGTQSRLYFNGLLAGTTTLDGTFGSNTTNFKIADPAWSTAQLDVATLQFYNRVLTVDEIARNYAVDKHRLGL